MDEGHATGAVVACRRTAEQAGHWDGNHHGVPIFVVSYNPPGPDAVKYPLVTYVNDGVASAMTQAKAAANGKDVMMHGGTLAQLAVFTGDASKG